MNKIKQLTEQGKTVLIVSHNITDIADLALPLYASTMAKSLIAVTRSNKKIL